MQCFVLFICIIWVFHADLLTQPSLFSVSAQHCWKKPSFPTDFLCMAGMSPTQLSYFTSVREQSINESEYFGVSVPICG